MKPYLIPLLTLMLLGTGGHQLWAQAEDRPQYERPQFLLQEPIRFSGFGGPIYEYSVVAGDFTVATGGGGALLINQQLFLGGYGMGSHHHDPLVVNGRSYDRVQTNFSHGGLWIGYIHQSHQLIHFTASVKVAGGTIGLEDEDGWGFDDNRQLAHDGVFVLTPQVEAELNVLKWMKLNAGVGYRAVSGVEVSTFSNADFSSLQGTFALMFGWFNQ